MLQASLSNFRILDNLKHFKQMLQLFFKMHCSKTLYNSKDFMIFHLHVTFVAFPEYQRICCANHDFIILQLLDKNL